MKSEAFVKHHLIPVGISRRLGGLAKLKRAPVMKHALALCTRLTTNEMALIVYCKIEKLIATKPDTVRNCKLVTMAVILARTIEIRFRAEEARVLGKGVMCLPRTIRKTLRVIVEVASHR
ncbi:MAG: hypothetical protein R3B70_10725 [Polyangiaceae bacterium]